MKIHLNVYFLLFYIIRLTQTGNLAGEIGHECATCGTRLRDIVIMALWCLTDL